jgi:DNA-binding HxlR family transcriptional regulator
MKPSHSKLPAICVSSQPRCGFSAEVCQSVGEVLARVGDKWSILVIYMLSSQAMRFGELKRSLGSISQKVLTTTLRGLERDGYVTREVTPSIPPRVDYELTKLGRDALKPVEALAMWAILRRKDIETARKRFDVKAGNRRKTT